MPSSLFQSIVFWSWLEVQIAMWGTKSLNPGTMPCSTDFSKPCLSQQLCVLHVVLIMWILLHSHKSSESCLKCIFVFSPQFVKKAFFECNSSHHPCELLGEMSHIKDLQSPSPSCTVTEQLVSHWDESGPWHKTEKSLFPCIYPGVGWTVLPLICENHRVLLFTFSLCSAITSRNQRLERKGEVKPWCWQP